MTMLWCKIIIAGTIAIIGSGINGAAFIFPSVPRYSILKHQQKQQQQQKRHQEHQGQKQLSIRGVSSLRLADITTTMPVGEIILEESSLSSNNKASSYGAGQITVLEGLEPVRKRPGMYIGSTGVDGLHHLVWEVLDNCVDEALSGYASLITLTLNDDGSCTMIDDGRGIPCDTHPTTGKSALETVLTVLHAGGKFENDGYKVSGGLHGVGISVVNALSEFTKVRVWRKSSIGEASSNNEVKRHEMEFQRGVPVNDLNVIVNAHPANDIDTGLKGTNDINKKQAKIETTVVADDEETLSKSGEKQKKRLELEKFVLDLHSKRQTGTEVTFLPDIEVFKGANGKPGIEFEIERLKSRLDEIAYLNAGLTLTLHDKRISSSKKKKNADQVHIFYHAGGLSEYIDILCQTKTPLFGANAPKGKKAATTDKNTKKTAKRVSKKTKLPENHPLQSLLSPDHSTILCKGTIDTINGPVSASIAIRYSADQYTETIYSFVNNIRTRDGGTHVEGLKSCLTRTVNSCAKRLNKLKGDGANLPGEFVREGLTAILSVSVPDPEFEGQTKGRLGNPEVRTAIDSLLAPDLTTIFDFQPEILERIVEKASSAQSAAVAARAARDMIRRKSLLTSTVLPGKLADCASRDPNESEIFIVEGDSAAGSAKQGRDRRTQAILPLRGKILNIEKCAAEKIYQNTELQGLISALGLGVRDEAFDEKGLRYKRIVIMTDADVDGAHIRVLLLTFFFRYQREMIENGFVYIAQPPLYKVVVGKKERYCFDEAEKELALQEMTGTVSTDGDGKSKKVTIQRFKGLGEMMPQQLWDTTMDPEKRIMLKVTVNDCALADQTLGMLMGDSVGPRRDFIVNSADGMSIEDLDV